MEKTVIGILAHVDAGKTTLSEAMLYESGVIRRLGRVDNRDAYLDTNELERERGITIFSKQAVFPLGDKEVTLLDTPGHVDFSAEMERSIQVLDYAILVVSGADGVQGHTRTVFRLLEKYGVPVFLFINKMDQNGCDREALLAELKQSLSESCVDFTDKGDESFYENVAVCADETLLEQFLETGTIQDEAIKRLIGERKIYPCYFGSALKLFGVRELMDGLRQYVGAKTYGEEFAARVYKITRDNQGNRLAHMKITGGSLKVKMRIGEEKVNQIRIYSGEKYEAVEEAAAGSICAVTGLMQVSAGEGLGALQGMTLPVLEPVLNYRLYLPDGMDAAQALPKLRQLEEEEPQLHLVWDETAGEILVQLMGEVQIEILKRLIWERFGIEAEFGAGKIVYKETIADTVEGVGHFEPLRHYAEVHLVLEPLENGCGMQFAADCSEDVLDKNWQRLILTHLSEKDYKGVLTGSSITDMKITLVSGRAHQKHTEGGDFRQATYRAVRQGLMQAESVLLEPYYAFRLELPEQYIGRAMTDIEKMYGKTQAPELRQHTAVLCGSAPVACMRDYPREVLSYARGEGHIELSFQGYYPCHNAEEVIGEMGYDPLRDVENTPDSVFCAHGAGFIVSWDQVREYMHVEAALDAKPENEEWDRPIRAAKESEELWVGTDEIDAILERTYHANSRDKERIRNGVLKKRRIQKVTEKTVRTYQPKPKLTEYLLVDGYNIIFAWEELKELAAVNIDGARGRLLDILCNYQGIRGCQLIVVFDAYRVEGHQTEIFEYHNIHVVYTKEAETADQYIEKFAHENGRKYDVTVATSDGLEQIIIRGAGCALKSARELKEEIEQANRMTNESYTASQPAGKAYLLDAMSGEERERLKQAVKKEDANATTGVCDKNEKNARG